MFQYRETVRRVALTLAGISTFYLSGCIAVPNSNNREYRDVSKNQQNNPPEPVARLQSQEERYHFEKKENEHKDLLKYINPDIKKSVENTRDGVDGLVSTILPGQPTLKGSRLVWRKDW